MGVTARNSVDGMSGAGDRTKTRKKLLLKRS